MVIITDANGNIQAPTIPENVYQGSNLANEIVFLAPLPQSNQCSITFRLPNGTVTEQQFMTPYTDVPSQYDLSAWVFKINKDITALYGQVSFQIRVYGAVNVDDIDNTTTIVSSCQGTFPVLRGVAPLPSSTPSTNTFTEIMTYLSYFSEQVLYGYVLSKGILPYDANFTYPSGANVFDKDTSAIYTSKQDNNIGNDLSNTDWWDVTHIQSLSQAEIQNMIDTSIASKQDVIDSSHKLSADLVDDTSTTNKFVTASDITTWNGKQDALTAGSNITISSNVISADVPAVENNYSSSQDNVYSAKFVNDNFVPISFASRIYLVKDTTTSATLEDAKPTPSASNVLTTTTTNTSFDWSSPMITLTRTLERAITINNTNSFAIDLYFNANRQATITFGAKIKVSTDNGSTWTYISNNQEFGAKGYINGLNSEDFVVYTDALTTPTNYAIGTLLSIEIFTKQEHNSSLTLEYYCGVTDNATDIYSFIEFNFANVNINTEQIEDGAVTYAKLESRLQSDIDKVENPSTTPTQDSTDLITSGAVYSGLSGKEDTTNKVTSLSSASTDTEYPSAKCVYDAIPSPLTDNEIDTIMDAILV